jgi:hypothetical protein
MKRALLIGINYVGTSSELYGCINDIKNVFYFLTKYRNYPSANMTILSDDGEGIVPSKQNIIAAIDALVSGVKAGDELFFHYSGHGSLVRDRNGDEITGADSCLCPVDYATAGFIIDDDIRSRLINKIPAGAKLYIILDCCHNGTGCDIRYRYDDNSVYNPRNKSWLTMQRMSQLNYPVTTGDVYMISGCRDDQTSADTVFDNKAAGALTYFAVNLLRTNPLATYSWSQYLRDLRYYLRTYGYTQVPQIMSGKMINPNQAVMSDVTISSGSASASVVGGMSSSSSKRSIFTRSKN